MFCLRYFECTRWLWTTKVKKLGKILKKDITALIKKNDVNFHVFGVNT